MSKGGSTTSSAEIPAWLENAGIENINRANDVSKIGYTPYYGPEVAAFNPLQLQSMKTTGNAASAFGLAPQGFDATAGIPTPTDYAGGIQGYSSMPLYNESMAAFTAARPGQAAAINNMFIDPFTGAPSSGNYAATETQKEQMINRDPADQPDYSININNSADGGTGGTGGAATSDSQGTYDAIYNQTTSTDLTGGDTFVGDDGGTYEVGYGEGQVDHGLANAVVDNQNTQGVNDAIYPQANSNDLTNGDTFTGADGQMYTVGGGEGQVDAGLANAVIAAGAGTTTALPDSNVTTDYNWDSSGITGYDLENGLPAANSSQVTNNTSSTSTDSASYTPAEVPVSSSGVVDPVYSNSQAVGNIAEAGVQGVVNNGLLGMGYEALTGNELIPATGSQDAPVSELSNADARPRTGLLSPQFDDLNVAKDNLMDLIQNGTFDDVYDVNGDGSLNVFDLTDLADEARNRGVKLTESKKSNATAMPTPAPNSTTTFGTKGSKAEVNADGVTTYNQKFWANQLKAGVSQADLKIAQDALQDPNTPWNDAYSDVAINGTDWFKGIKKTLTAKDAAATLLEENDKKAAAKKEKERLAAIAAAKKEKERLAAIARQNNGGGDGGNDNGFSGGSGTSDSAMGSGTAKSGYNFGL